MLALIDSGANGIGIGGKRFDLGTGMGEFGLVGFAALEAGEFFIFEAVGLRGGELDFVFDGFRLRRRLDGVELGAKASGLLAVFINLAFEAGTQRIFAGQGSGDLSRAVLCGGECSLGAGNLAGERAQFLAEAAALQFEVLQFHEIFNPLVHHVQEAYGIKRGWGKWGRD